MTITAPTLTPLEKARAFVDAGHLMVATGADMKDALWELNQSTDELDVLRAIAIRDVWRNEHDAWAEHDRQILKIWDWRP